MYFAFWLFLALIFYVYIGYPVLLYILSGVVEIYEVKKAKNEPMVSFIIAAYNEEKCIALKIENTLALDYPKEKLEIIVASDCSDDQTDKIVENYKDENVVLNRQKERLGKTAAQNDSVLKAAGEILVFSDATTLYKKDSLKKIVQNFNDESVGCVGGELNYVNPSGENVGKGGGLYWKYECAIRERESKVSSLIGVSGCMYAVSKKFYRPIANDLISDFVIASIVREQNGRTVHEPDAICYEDTTRTTSDEFNMRVRVVVRSLRGLLAYKKMLNIKKYGFFAVQLWSHKVLRYMVPFFLIGLFLTNGFILTNIFFVLFFIAQILFYFVALLCLMEVTIIKKNRISYISYYFCLVNAAALKGVFGFLSGRKDVVWKPLRD